MKLLKPEPSKKHLAKKPLKTAIVVGSGFGGLSLAIRLQAAGVQVTLLEMREKVGGRAYQFQEKGYTFDMGPSLITAPEIIDSIFQAAGKKMEDYFELTPLDPFYRVYFHDGTYIDYCGDGEKMKQQMRAFNLEDAENFDAFMEACAPIHEAVIGQGLGAKPFGTIRSMLAFAPKAIKLGVYKPVHQVVKKYFKDPRHQFLYSFHPLFIGGNPFKAPSVYLMIPYLEKEGGVWFSKGGMYSLVQALEKVFVELGGTVHTSHEVTKLHASNRQITGVEANGKRFEADVVVSNADFGHTYKDLIEEKERKKWTNRKVEKVDYTMSCFLLYMGVSKKYDNLKHHTLILSERYRDLITDIFDNKILPDDFSMYLHAPTKTDPEMAPEGCESLYVLIPVANLRSGIDWEAIKDAFADKVLAFLEQWGLTDLRENLDVLKLFTPLDFKDKLNAFEGNAFAVEPKLTQTAYLRPHNKSEDFDNLFLVGAGTHPGAGVPGVMLSAQATVAAIQEHYALGLHTLVEQ